MPEPDLFSDQARERPDASSPTGRKYVFEDDPEPKGETLPDGRFDGEGEWSRESILQAGGFPKDMTHNQWALWMLYNHDRITRKMFADETDEVFGKPSFKLPARIADLRQIDDAPPIRTDEDADPTEWFIPKADPDQ